MIRPILKYGDPVLHEAARGPSTPSPPEIDRLDRRHDRDDVRRARRRAGGAADRACRCASSSSTSRSAAIRPGLMVMINPEFVERDGMQLEEEGCLSVPGFNATVVRPSRAVVKGLDRHGNRASARRHRSAGARLSARDGSSRRHAVRRSPPRHQARSHRQADQEADPRRQMVDAPLRIVFFGTPDFAVPTLDALLASRHPVVGVVTQPDRPRGRGQKTSEPPVKARALAAGLPVLQPERLKDEGFLAAFAALDADLGVVAAYGKILTDAVLATPRLGMLNVHASLLPRYRGAAPVHRAVIDGERETGVTIMRVVKALDAGPMLATARRPIGPDETSDEVERDLARLGAALLVATVDALAAGPVHGNAAGRCRSLPTRIASPRTTASSTGRSRRRRIHNLIRGLHPWPHAFTFYRGRRLILLRSTVEMPNPGSEPTNNASAVAAPGTILEAAGDRLHMATGEGTLAITQIQAEGKRPMTAREFLAGHPPRGRRDPDAAPMIAPARVAAYEILSAVEAGRADLSDALAATRTTLRDDRDKALAAEIAIGVQRWRAALDHLIAHFARRPIQRLDREVLEILRLSAYQLLHLTRVPAAAVVDDAVDLTGRVGKRSASGLVNAVLRAISRHSSRAAAAAASGRSGRSPARTRVPGRHAFAPAVARLTLVRRLRLRRHRDLAAVQQRAGAADASRQRLAQYAAGVDRAASERRGRRPPGPLRARCAHRRGGASLARRGPRCRLVRRAGRSVAARHAAGRRRPWRARARHLRLARRQDDGAGGGDAGARAARRVRRPRSAHGSAAPDGRRQRRHERSPRSGRSAAAAAVRSRAFDCVFVDAPCSGLGTLRRDPDIKWRRQEDDLRALAAAQLEMLRHAAEAVAPGGRLIYATCSSEPEENESVADAFPPGRRRTFPRSIARPRAALPPAVINERGPSANVSARPRARGVLRRGLFDGAADAVSHDPVCGSSDRPSTIFSTHGPQNPRLERGQRSSCSPARSSRPTCCSPPPRCGSPCARAR